MREFFQRTEDGNVVNIEVDMNAYAYSKKYSWLFSVFIKYEPSSETQEGYEEFLETKESLIIALEHEEKAKFVGIRIVDGWSEFYFYADDSKGLDATVAKMLNPSNYVYESNVVRDSKWDFHHKNLSPSDLELASIESQKIIFLLEEEGDDLEKIRPVEHYVSFETPTQKNRFLSTLTLEGFTFKDEIESEEFANGLALMKDHSVTSQEVQKEIENIFEALKETKGYYEGWSTVLANDIQEV
jgi:hypothetical protein